jgi:hypothetical protein
VGDVGDFGDNNATVESEYKFPVERRVEEMQPRHGARVDNVRTKEASIIQPTPWLGIAKRPTTESVPLADIAVAHNAPGLWEALQDYIDMVDPDLTFQLSGSMKIGVWSFCKLKHDPLPFAPLVGSMTDFVQATLAEIVGSRQTREANCDTVLIETYGDRKGIYHKYYIPLPISATFMKQLHTGYHVGHVRVIFQLPYYAWRVIPEPLAYVELFDQFSPQLRPSELYSTCPSHTGHTRKTEVILLSHIRMVCHLVPKYSDKADRRPLSVADDLLSSFPVFYLNHFSSYYSWSLFDHWACLGVN